MVTEPTSDDRVVHDWLVRFVFEVRVPSRSELRAGPAVHLLKFVLSWTNLDTGFDTVGCKWTSAVNIPLVVNLLLSLFVATDEVVEALDVWLGPVGGEGQVVILEIETDTRQIDQRLNASLAKLLRAADTRALEDEWRAQGTSRHDDLLASLIDSGLLLTG